MSGYRGSAVTNPITSASAITLDDLRRYAVARTLFTPTTLGRAIHKLGFVQVDPIRSPARAQDLTLRHRVKDYGAGDLERRYSRLPVEEDFFVNYGVVPREHQVLMHPRRAMSPWSAAQQRRARDVLRFVCERGTVHPREVDAHFAHGTVTNYWGGASNATTHLLDAMHYRGLLRIVRRDNGIRVYAARQHASVVSGVKARRERIDALIDIVLRKYAPLPVTSLNSLVRRLRYGAPQLRGEIDGALVRAKQRLAYARIDGLDWYWPADEDPLEHRREVFRARDQRVRLLAPFDPIVWDRRRFELFWGWAYRFEAYTPAHKRKLGYYALPLLWDDQVIGWANLAVKNATLVSDFGFVAGHAPQDAAFKRELAAELERLRVFLRL